jgi:hypothetical protein
MSKLQISFDRGNGYLLYDISCKDGNGKSIYFTETGLGSNIAKRMNNLQEYFEEISYYEPFTLEFQMVEEDTCNHIAFIADTAPSITLGVFLHILIYSRGRVLKSQWDSVIVTGDLSYNSSKDKEVQLKSVFHIPEKYTTVEEHTGERNVLFVYISSEECTKAKNTNRITVRRFEPGKNNINEILGLIFEPHSLSKNPPDLKGERKWLYKSFDESQVVFTKINYIRPDDFDEIEDVILYDKTWMGYYIYGEGESGKSATAVGISRYLGWEGMIYAPIWIWINNEDFSVYTDKYHIGVRYGQYTAGNITASDKFIYSRIYNKLFQTNLAVDDFSREHMNSLINRFDKRYLIVIDNLELTEDKIILVLESVKKLLFSEGVSYKPFIIVTSRTEFDDKNLLDDQGIKPIKPLALKKHETFFKEACRGREI